jgi:hypothetical protein
LARKHHKSATKSKSSGNSPADSKVARSSPVNGRFRAAKFVAINAFLIFHIVAIACWAIPVNTPLTEACKNLVRPYFIWSGVFQSWDMFSPNPKSRNAYVEAVVIYKDGSTEMYSFPRMELLSVTERAYKERYRKYEEVLINSDFAELWPDAARHVARMYANRATPPQRVMLVVRYSDIIPRDDGGYDRGPWNFNVFYSYQVQPEDLQ